MFRAIVDNGQTHPQYGKYQSRSVYGIKSVAFYAPRLRTASEDCATAATSSDARDKYFLSYINELELSPSKVLRSELPVLTVSICSVFIFVSASIWNQCHVESVSCFVAFLCWQLCIAEILGVEQLDAL